MKISTVEQMRELDRTAIETYGIKEELLMENAGLASYHVIRKTCCNHNQKRFTVLCGSGNNGGDGFVVARKLRSVGAEVTVFLLGNPDKVSGAAKLNFDILSTLSVEIQELSDIETFRNAVMHADVIIDALFGTGITRNAEGLHAEAIRTINESGRIVYSLDIPSGINGNTGEIMGVAVKADHTITFGLPKLGNILYPGWIHGGQLTVSHISFPPQLYIGENSTTNDYDCEINLPPRLPERKENGHKGSFGKALFVAGAANYYGAPFFSSESYLKAGGGYSRLASTSSVVNVVAGMAHEVVFHPMKETATGSIAYGNLDVLKMLSSQVSFAVLGPGVSLNDETQKLIIDLAKRLEVPISVDGDGLTAVARNPHMFKDRTEPTILTPHPGEMSRLSGTPIKEIEADRVGTARRQAEELNAVIVLKGAHTVIAFPDKRVYVNMSGNSGMGTAGSGDVLTGTIAAMYGQGLAVEDAVKAGVFIHGFAGDLAASDIGEDGMTAHDILVKLPQAVKMYREVYDEIMKNMMGCVEVE
jgi:NAD(P)H-hydrate epimerase